MIPFWDYRIKRFNSFYFLQIFPRKTFNFLVQNFWQIISGQTLKWNARKLHNNLLSFQKKFSHSYHKRHNREIIKKKENNYNNLLNYYCLVQSTVSSSLCPSRSCWCTSSLSKNFCSNKMRISLQKPLLMSGSSLWLDGVSSD